MILVLVSCKNVYFLYSTSAHLHDLDEYFMCFQLQFCLFFQNLFFEEIIISLKIHLKYTIKVKGVIFELRSKNVI